MSARTAGATVVLRLASIIVASVGLSVSLTWLAYATYFAPFSDLLAADKALLSFVFPAVALVPLVCSKPLARLITVDLGEIA